MDWSVVLPVKDELNYLRYSLPSILKLQPSEIILCLDYKKEYDERQIGVPFDNPISRFTKKTREKYGVPLTILYIKRNPKWRFHQAYVRRMGYLEAKHDRIFTFDVDTTVTPEILKGYDSVGKDGVTFVTFRKKLATTGFTQILRSLLYDFRRKVPQRKLFSTNRVRQPFIGIYWLFRPFYLDLIREEVVSKIYNGEDTLAQMLIESHPFYKHIHRDDLLGCISLRYENEDTKWRQEQLGIYWGCMQRRNTAIIARSLSFLRVVAQVSWKLYFHIIKGYFIGRQYHEELAKKICSHSYAEMVMYSKYNDGVWHFDYPT